MKPLKNVERDTNREGETRERPTPSSPILVVYHSINDSTHLFCQFGWVGWQLLCRRPASSFLCFLSILLPWIFIHISSSLPFFKPDFLFHFFQIAVFNCLTTMDSKSMIFKQKRYCKGKKQTVFKNKNTTPQDADNSTQNIQLIYKKEYNKKLSY